MSRIGSQALHNIHSNPLTILTNVSRSKTVMYFQPVFWDVFGIKKDVDPWANIQGPQTSMTPMR